MDISYLFLHRPYGRGSGRYLRYLMDYFKKKNRINLICGMEIKSYPGVNVYTPKIPFQIPVYHGRTDVKKNVKLSKISDRQFFKLIDLFTKTGLKVVDSKNSLMHANHCSIMPYCCSLIKEKIKVPYIITAHGTGVLSSLESKRNFKVANKGIEDSELIISNSKFTASRVKNNFNVKSSKIKVVYLGVDTKEFKPLSSQKKNAIKKKYNCLDNKLVFSSGYFDKDKGFQDLVRAAKIYEKKGITTLVSGIGPYHSQVNALIKKLKLKNARLLGWIPKQDLIKLYAAADLYVFPSRWDEPFGLVAVEAMSSGTSVIGTKVGGIPEIVGGNGILVESKNHTEIAKAVNDHIFDDNWLMKNSKKARDIVKSKFDYVNMCKETEKIYKKIISNNS